MNVGSNVSLGSVDHSVLQLFKWLHLASKWFRIWWSSVDSCSIITDFNRFVHRNILLLRKFGTLTPLFRFAIFQKLQILLIMKLMIYFSPRLLSSIMIVIRISPYGVREHSLMKAHVHRMWLPCKGKYFTGSINTLVWRCKLSKGRVWWSPAV